MSMAGGPSRALRELPPHWEVVRLGEVVEFTKKPRGLTTKGPVPFVPMRLIPEHGLWVSEFEERSTASGTYFEEGDFLLARITPCFENGKQGIVRNIPGGWGMATTEVYALRSEVFSSRFLALYFQWHEVRSHLVRRMEGATGRMRVPKEALEEMLLPVPPRAEQDRIVEAVESAMDAVHRAANSLVEAEARLLHFRAAVLHTQLPVNETSTVLGDVADVRSGLTKGRKIKGEAKDVPFLRAANVQEGRLDLDEIKTIPATATERERFELRDGDVLLVEGSGSPHRLGQGWIWRGEISGCLHQNHVFRARPNRDLVMPEYLAWAMQSPAARDHFRRMAKTTSGLSTINRTQIEATPVPLPPLDEQREVVARLERLRQTHATLTDELQQLQGEVSALRRSILHQAFTGQLVTQDPADEPASELLKRIEAEKAEREAELKARRRRKGRSGSSAETAEALPRPPSQSGKVGTSSD